MRIPRLLFIAFGLFLDALSTQAAPPATISSLPHTITASGTYVLAGNLSSSDSTNAAAIRIQTNIPGPVTVDLKGFTLTGGGGNSVGIGIGILAGTTESNSYPITIQNGTLANFAFGVWAQCGTGIGLSQVTVRNLSIDTNGQDAGNGGTGVLFRMVASSTISNCTFHAGSFGIEDVNSLGGNRYINDRFVSTNPLFITGQDDGVPTILNNCQFDRPPTP
jgi:hypothetical protein